MTAGEKRQAIYSPMQGTKHTAFERMMMEVPKRPARMEPQRKPQKKKRQYTYQKGDKE